MSTLTSDSTSDSDSDDVRLIDRFNDISPVQTAAELSAIMTDEFQTLRPGLRRYHYKRWTVNLCQDLYRNAISACHRHSSTSKTRFPLFNNLPAEIRSRVWHIAATIPEIIVLEPVPNTTSKTYKPTIFPALLTTCRESHHEFLLNKQLKSLSLPNTSIVNSPWLDYSHDIFHIRDLDFCDRWTPVELRVNEGPECFKHIEALALSRDILFKSPHHTDVTIRGFFFQAACADCAY